MSDSHDPFVTREQQAMHKVMGYISPPAVMVIVGICIIAGYFLGWYVNDNSDMSVVCFIAGILMFFALKYPLKAWNAWRQSMDDETIEARFNKHYTPGPHEFDHDDFDAAAQQILAKSVKAARKQKGKVTVPMLLGDMMKSVR